MRVFVRIGSIPSNKSGVGSRAWCVRRSGTVVLVTWGGIEVEKQGGRVRFFWAAGWPQSLRYRRGTVAKANAFIAQKIRTQLGKGEDGGYHRLPAGTRIRVRRARAAR
jgi:hypothetical protein